MFIFIYVSDKTKLPRFIKWLFCRIIFLSSLFLTYLNMHHYDIIIIYFKIYDTGSQRKQPQN